MLLEYALGDERSFLWAVTQTSIASFELPRREQIETAARRFYELLTAPTQQYRGMKDTRGLRVAKADAQDQKVAEVAAALSKLVLSPVAARLKQKRLLIVSEGALQYVPE